MIGLKKPKIFLLYERNCSLMQYTADISVGQPFDINTVT